MKTIAIVPAAALALALMLTASPAARAGDVPCNNPAHHHGNNYDFSPPTSYRGGILPAGPGYGYGFPNGNPDGYGWWDHGGYLPLGANRTAEYYFNRKFAVPCAAGVFAELLQPDPDARAALRSLRGCRR